MLVPHWLLEALFDHSGLPLAAAVGVAPLLLLGDGEEPLLAVAADVPDAAALRVGPRDADPCGLLLGVRDPEAHADADKGAEALLGPLAAAVAVRSVDCVRAKLEERVAVEEVVTEGRAAPPPSKIRCAAAAPCAWRKCCGGAASAEGATQQVSRCRRNKSKSMAPHAGRAAGQGDRGHDTTCVTKPPSGGGPGSG